MGERRKLFPVNGGPGSVVPMKFGNAEFGGKFGKGFVSCRGENGERQAFEREQPDLRPALEKRFRVPAGSDRRIHEEPAALRREQLHDLPQKNRRVLPLPNVLRLPSPVFRRSTLNSQLSTLNFLQDISSFDISS